MTPRWWEGTETYIVDGGNEQQRRRDDVEEDDEGKNHQHVHRAVKANGAAGKSREEGGAGDGRDKSKPVNDKTQLKSTTFNRISENLGQLFPPSCLHGEFTIPGLGGLCNAGSQCIRGGEDQLIPFSNSAGTVAQLVELLLSTHEALGSIPHHCIGMGAHAYDPSTGEMEEGELEFSILSDRVS